MSSPTQRSLKHMRDLGYRAGVTERWNQFAGIRQDLFGFIDVLAYHPEKKEVVAVQTTASGTSERVNKILGLEQARDWLKAGCRIEVHGWRKVTAYKADGTKCKEKKYEIRVINVSLTEQTTTQEGK